MVEIGKASKKLYQPTLNVPLLKAFNVHYGPAQMLGRFFMNIDHRYRQQGLEFSFADFAEVADVQKRNVENWSFMNPMFDPAVADIPEGRAFCIVGRNSRGEVVTTGSGKLLNASKRSFKEIVNSGDFFSIRPADNINGITTEITAPVAETMHGEIVYVGGIWVHPDLRGLRLASLWTRLVNGVALALWEPDLTVGFVRAELDGSGYHKRYSYTNADQSLFIKTHERVLLEAVLCWMTMTDAAEDIAHFLDGLWPEVDAGVAAGGGKKAG